MDPLHIDPQTAPVSGYCTNNMANDTWATDGCFHLCHFRQRSVFTAVCPSISIW